MALLLPGGQIQVQHNLASTAASTWGTTVTTGGTTATKGTPAQLIAATSFDAHWIRVIASSYGTAATVSQGSFDILIGTSTEEVLIPDLLMGYCGGDLSAASNAGKVWDFPLYIPAGARLAAQAAGARITTAVQVSVFLYGGYIPFGRVGSKVTTYGMGTVPDGTSITSGASGAEGSWTQITATTIDDHFALMPSFQITGDTTLSGRNYAVDIGQGAATEEQIAEGYMYSQNVQEQMSGPWNPMPCMVQVPSGTRLVMRASCSGTTATGLNGVIHGVT
jgi:hypothetical protein